MILLICAASLSAGKTPLNYLYYFICIIFISGSSSNSSSRSSSRGSSHSRSNHRSARSRNSQSYCYW